MSEKLNDKLYQYLVHLFDKDGTEKIHEYLNHSEILYAPDHSGSWNNAIKLIIISDPEIYKKYSGEIHFFNNLVQKELNKMISGSIVTSVQSKPNLNKFQVVNNRYVSVITPWEEINQYQDKMIEQLRTAQSTIDFQNIGNTARTIMQKLSDIVFNPDTHNAPKGVDVSEGKFKNRLHTYIKSELSGEANQEIRNLAVSLIDTAENSIDVANKLTHSLNANLFIAETCVGSTISAINIIKSIVNKEK